MQLSIALVFLDRFGVYAVIAGKAAGILTGQIGHFYIIRWKLDDIQFGPPHEYWIALAVTMGAGYFAINLTPLSFVWSLFVYIALLTIFLVLIRFRIQEILVVVSRFNRSRVADIHLR